MSLRIAVIGVGYLGRHHARILSDLPGVELVAVVDTNRARAEEVAEARKTRPMVDYREVVGQVDAVTIAVPTERHLEIAAPLLKAGLPVLVEKPMARSLAEADAMIAAAREAGVLLSVGHTERFNPAVAEARPLLADPRFIEVHRLGTFPERSLDIDVVFDLMIHDLDVLLSLVTSDVESIEAVGVPVLTGRVDIANARLPAFGVPVNRLYGAEDRGLASCEEGRRDAFDSRGSRRGCSGGAAQARARGFYRRRSYGSGPYGIRSGRPSRARARDPDSREDVFVLCIATFPSSLPIWTSDGSLYESLIA